MSYSIKVKHGDDLRRVTMTGNPPTMASLTQTLQSLFNSPSGAFKVRYQDDDGDLVTISSDQELLEAFLTVKQLPLRLDVIPLSATPVAVRVSPPAQEKEAVPEEAAKPLVPSRSSSVSSASSFAVVTGKEDEEDELESEGEEEDHHQQQQQGEEEEEEEVHQEQKGAESDDESTDDEDDDDDKDSTSTGLSSDEDDDDDGEDEEVVEVVEEVEGQRRGMQPSSPVSSSPAILGQVSNNVTQPTSPSTLSAAATPQVVTIISNPVFSAAAVVEEEHGSVAGGNSSDDTLATATATSLSSTSSSTTTSSTTSTSSLTAGNGDEQQQEQQQQEQPEGQEDEAAIPEVPLVDYFLNEFHYHRLIVQTAVESAFAAHRPKAGEFLNRMDTQRVLIINAIDKTLEEWRRDIGNYPPAKDISNRVSEALSELGTFAAPVIERIRVTLNAALESLFERKSPEAITSADVVRELDTFSGPVETPHPTSASASAELTQQQEQEEKQQQQEEKQQQQEEKQQQQEDELRHVVSESTSSQTAEGLDTLLAQLAEGQFRAGDDAPADLRIPSELTDDFVYLDGFQNEEELAARRREHEAHLASEVVWENSEEFPYEAELAEIQLMGLTDVQAIREALITSNGNMDQAVNSLFP